MTLIVTLACKDGVVIASDGQETAGTSGGIIGVISPKIKQLGTDKLWAGAGAVGLLQDIERDFASLTQTDVDSPITGNHFRDAIRTICLNHRKKAVAICNDQYGPGNDHRAPTAEIVVVSYSTKQPYLWHMPFDCNSADFRQHEGYYCIGTGDMAANGFLIHYQNIIRKSSVDKGKQLAYRAIETAIKLKVSGIGIPIDIWTIDNKRIIHQLSPGEIHAIADAARAKILGKQKEAKKDKAVLRKKQVKSKPKNPSPVNKRNIKVVWMTAISGSGKGEYLNQFKVFAEKRKLFVEHFDVGDMMVAVSGIPDPKEILNINPAQLTAYRYTVMEKIIGEINRIRKKKKTVVIITTHSCFRWEHFLTRSFDPHYLQQIEPDIYVTLTGDAAKIRERLAKSSQWDNRLADIEVIHWRDEEIFISKILALYHGKPHYVISFKDDAEMFYNIIQSKMLRFYLSYPISNIRKHDPGFLDKILTFADTVRKHFIVFNPLSIQDLQKDLDKFGETETKALRGQTKVRDHYFIDQSDFIVVIWPTDEQGRADRSFGVSDEMTYAKNSGKKVYAYITESSPFLDTFVTKPFNKLPDLINELSSIAKKKIEIPPELIGV